MEVVDGDVLGALGTASSLVSSSYQSNSGILTLTNPTGSSDNQKLASFQDAINKTFYTTVNYNPSCFYSMLLKICTFTLVLIINSFTKWKNSLLIRLLNYILKFFPIDWEFFYEEFLC